MQRLVVRGDGRGGRPRCSSPSSRSRSGRRSRSATGSSRCATPGKVSQRLGDRSRRRRRAPAPRRSRRRRSRGCARPGSAARREARRWARTRSGAPRPESASNRAGNDRDVVRVLVLEDPQLRVARTPRSVPCRSRWSGSRLSSTATRGRNGGCPPAGSSRPRTRRRRPARRAPSSSHSARPTLPATGAREHRAEQLARRRLPVRPGHGDERARRAAATRARPRSRRESRVRAQP